MQELQLTEAQRKFAEEHHNLIFSFLNAHRLTDSEWYGVAALGFCKAVVKFDPGRKRKFSTFAFRVMLNDVRSEMRRERNRTKGATLVSLDSEVSEGFTLGDVVGTEQDFMPEDEMREELGAVIRSLSATEQLILEYLEDGAKQREIAEIIGVSQPQVSRQIRAIKEKFINELYAQEGEADGL